MATIGDGTRTIALEALARVEGEGALSVRIEDGRAAEVALRIYEPPRFFEGILRGRDMAEPVDITARICGICPVAYMMSACHAVEDACGVRVGGAIRDLRRLLYCGEWIESHSMHLFMLHAPDFLGYDSAVAMARDHRDMVTLGLRLKKAGNSILALLGGREIHPINVRVGGFYRAPSRGEVSGLKDELSWARDAAWEVVRWTSRFGFPDLERDYELVALVHPTEYPIDEGTIASDRGLAIRAAEWGATFEERQVPHSTALHSIVRGRGPYLCGPLARYSLNFERLSPLAREAAAGAGLAPVCKNPYRSIVVRAVEILYACDEALRLIDQYREPARAAVPVAARAAEGHGVTEAPRGTLYHRYRIDGDGRILDAQIVPPTSQNQKSIEDDVVAVIESGAALPDEEIARRCEQAIRNHDPCISCSAHFLTVDIERGGAGSCR